MFKYIVGFAALVVAGCAAFFSVQGLATLYAGQFIAVCVMAGGLEFGKLVAASYLHRYWKETSFLLRTYLIIAVISLMAITSLGIFGFLTSAYQSSLVEYSQKESEQNFIISQKDILQKELDGLDLRIKTLNESRLSQEKRLPEMSSKAAVPIYEDIKKSGEEINQIKNRTNLIFSEIKDLDYKSLELQKQSGKQKDIGTLKYASELFKTDLNTIVKWFTIAIILVFDPLAVSLVLAYNNISKNKKNSEIEEYTETPNTINYQKVNKEINVKYKDK